LSVFLNIFIFAIDVSHSKKIREIFWPFFFSFSSSFQQLHI